MKAREWRKSSHSAMNGNCVEVRWRKWAAVTAMRDARLRARVQVRDSKTQTARSCRSLPASGPRSWRRRNAPRMRVRQLLTITPPLEG